MENHKVQKQVFLVEGMTCSSCELKIEHKLKQLDGVQNVKVSMVNSNVAVTYDTAKLSETEIIAVIQKLGYQAGIDSIDQIAKRKKNSINQILGIGIIIFAFYMIIKSTIGFNFIPQVDQSVGLGMLFVIGLLTSLHCIAMCGGINLSQCVAYQPQTETRWEKFKPSFLYNSGRVISYTIIGGIVGVVGSLVSFSGTSKAMVTIFAGLFMVLIGVNMLNLFPWLRRFNLGGLKIFGNQVYGNNGKRGPFIVGLLNGLMPCGPLQTMQLYALGTGSFWAGATAMFLFSLGTVPLMFGFGAIGSFLSNKFTHKMLKVSAILVIVLGLIMVNRGLSLSGIGIAASASASNVAQIVGDLQEVQTTMESGRYQPLVVQKGIPVRWTIKAKRSDLNGCNNPLTIPKYGIQKTLVPGSNVIEFTPGEEGNITYTCWMGMISSNIKVVADLAKVNPADLKNDQKNNGGLNSSGSCCSAGAQATRFAGGRIPTDDLLIAKVINGSQEVKITVNDTGYAPAVVVVQKGIKTKIKFIPEKLNSCNYLVAFPEYQGQLDLSANKLETPEITPISDFTFQCGMGMLHGYVKVVDDINKVDLKVIKKEIAAYRPASGGGCCGR